MPFWGSGGSTVSTITTESTLTWTPAEDNQTRVLTEDEYGATSLIIANVGGNSGSRISFANSNGGHVFYVNNTSLSEDIQLGVGTSTVTLKAGSIQQIYVDENGNVTAITNDSLTTLKTLSITPESNTQTIVLTADEILENGVITITDSEFTPTTVSFENAATQKTFYVRNLDVDVPVKFGTIDVPASSVAQILVDAGGSTVLIQAPELYDDISKNPSPVTIVAASNSSASWKAKAEFICPGSTDQNMLNTAMNAYAGGIVYLAPGNYSISNTVYVPAGTEVIGADKYPNVIISTVQAGVTMISVNGSDAKLAYLKLRSLATGGTSQGIVIASGSTSVELNRCSVELASASNTPIGISAIGNQGTITECGVTCTAGTGIQVTGSKTTIDKTPIAMSGGTSVYGIYLSSGATGSIVNNCALTGAMTTSSAIYVGAGDAQITNNTISMVVDHGVYISGASNVVVSDNKITNVKLYGVANINSANIRIIRNNISTTENGSTCLYLSNTPKCIISQNILSGTFEYGIYNTESTDNIITNNIWTVPSYKHGIYVSTVNDTLLVTINHNEIKYYTNSQNSSGVKAVGATNNNVRIQISGNNIHKDSTGTTFTRYTFEFISSVQAVIVGNFYNSTASFGSADVVGWSSNTNHLYS